MLKHWKGSLLATLGFVAESLRDSQDSSPEMWAMISWAEKDWERTPFSHTHSPFLADFQTRPNNDPGAGSKQSGQTPD